jgi:hypothetical protein
MIKTNTHKTRGTDMTNELAGKIKTCMITIEDINDEYREKEIDEAEYTSEIKKYTEKLERLKSIASVATLAVIGKVFESDNGAWIIGN